MEHRSQKVGCAVSLVVTLMAIAPSRAAELTYQVRHRRPLEDHSCILKTRHSTGLLTINDQGVSYQQAVAEGTRSKNLKLERVRFDYQDIQELWLSPDKLVLVTYKDQKWLLCVDKQFEFYLPKGKSFQDAYAMLKDKLDRRFVAAIADPQPSALWELPVKLLGTIQGSEGLLQVGPDRIVYKTDRRRQSRTWRYEDIENISSSDRYQLTVVTYERARTQYGSRKNFDFQLKQPLDEKRFELLWKRLNRDKGLQFLTAIEDRN